MFIRLICEQVVCYRGSAAIRLKENGLPQPGRQRHVQNLNLF